MLCILDTRTTYYVLRTTYDVRRMSYVNMKSPVFEIAETMIGNLLSIEHDPFNRFERMIHQIKAKSNSKTTVTYLMM